MSLRPSPRPGFTLLEMVVVFAVLGTLAALTLPAIQKVRMAAARAGCASNMRQIGIAAHDRNHMEGKLPPAAVMPYAVPASPPSIADASGIPPPELLYDLTLTDSPARKNSDPIRYPFGPNWAVLLLPYIEQGNLYAESGAADYMEGYATGDTAKRDGWRASLRGRVVPVYRCPADNALGVPFEGYTHDRGDWARGNYAANAGPGWWQMSLDGRSYDETYGRTGPVMGINYGASIERVADGASSTIMFTEVRAGVAASDPRGAWAMGYPGSSVTAANAIGDSPTPNDRNETSDDIQGCPDFYYPGIGSRDRMGCNPGLAGLGWPSWQAQARSRHRGGVNVCLCDGSVHFVHNGIDQGVWFSLLSANDGRPPGSWDR